MDSQGINPSPDVDQIQQYPEYPYSVNTPVCIVDSAPLSVLPARHSRNMQFVLAANTPVEIVGGDPRIRRAWIYASATGVNMGTAEQCANQGSGGNQGYGIPTSPVAYEGFDIATYAVTSTGGTVVHVRLEFWAD